MLCSLISVLFIRRIVRLWYSRKEAYEGAYPLVILLSSSFPPRYREDAAAAEKGGEIKKTSYYTAHDLVYKCDESTALITLHPALGLRQRFNPVPSQPPRMPNNARNAVPPIHSFSILALHLVLRNTIQTSAATN